MSAFHDAPALPLSKLMLIKDVATPNCTHAKNYSPFDFPLKEPVVGCYSIKLKKKDYKM